MKKVIIFISILSFIFIFIYIYSTYFVFKHSDEKILSSNGKYILSISSKNPIMSFGSGHKELRLYTSFYLYLDKCILGEFPVELYSWDIVNKTINLNIQQHEISNLSYIYQYTNKNKKLGIFNINYQIVGNF
jgi:hypothetical protein